MLQKYQNEISPMELVQKLMKKTSKYLFYSPLTEKVLTECPCITVIMQTVDENPDCRPEHEHQPVHDVPVDPGPSRLHHHSRGHHRSHPPPRHLQPLLPLQRQEERRHLGQYL